MNFTPEELDKYDQHAKRELAQAVRRKQVVIVGSKVRFKLDMRGFIASDFQRILRTLVNLSAHDKAYAQDEPSELTSELHRTISCGHGFVLPVVLDLSDGTLRLDMEKE